MMMYGNTTIARDSERKLEVGHHIEDINYSLNIYSNNTKVMVIREQENIITKMDNVDIE